MNHFALVMQFLRDRQSFLEEVSKGIRIEYKIVSLLVCSSTFIAIYGAIIGLSNGWAQMLSSAIKLPALYLITLAICLPTLYFFEIIIVNSKRSFGQYLTLLLATTSVISVLLLAFAPIVLFFHLSINDYVFFKLLNVIIFALTGLIGINFLYRSMTFVIDYDEDEKQRSLIIKAWLVLYGFVGSQLG